MITTGRLTLLFIYKLFIEHGDQARFYVLPDLFIKKETNEAYN